MVYMFDAIPKRLLMLVKKLLTPLLALLRSIQRTTAVASEGATVVVADESEGAGVEVGESEVGEAVEAAEFVFEGVEGVAGAGV